MRNYSGDFQSECANSVDAAIRLASRVVDLIFNFSKLKPHVQRPTMLTFAAVLNEISLDYPMLWLQITWEMSSKDYSLHL